MSPEEKERQRLQLEAYNRRAEIKVGDRFIWNRGNSRKDCNRIYSGSLPHDYMLASTHHIPSGWSEAFTICKVYEGHNGYGPFVDYWLTDEPFFLKSREYKAKECLIINGPDAFKMERWEDVLDLPSVDHIRKEMDERIVSICTERQIITHCIGMDNPRHKPYSRNGRLYYRPYRNYFCTDANDKLWNLLCDNGLASHDRISREGLTNFWLTRKGLDWLGRRLNIKIHDEED